MKIIKCKECGEQIPANVESCPNCGCPTKAKSKSKKIIIIFGMAILCIVAASLYFLMGKNKTIGNHEFANDSISKDSVTQLSDTEHTKVTVDPSLVRTGGMGYSVFEEENGRTVTRGISLIYNVDSTQTYQGLMCYCSNKNETDYENIYEIPVIGEVANDGGLIFKGSLDNVAYSLHILNTHGTLNDDTYLNSYEAVFARGNKSRKIFIGFEHWGEEGD